VAQQCRDEAISPWTLDLYRLCRNVGQVGNLPQSGATVVEDMKPISVLLVDDNPAFLRIATRFLQQHDDLTVVGAASGGQEALTLAQDLQPDIVVIDLAMPGLNGLEAIPRLRAMLPEVGIIALTVLDTNSYREAALAAGANDFVAKVSLDTDLLLAIRRLSSDLLSSDLG
jgi:DNA-binding NarL/FixJ family response regulator